MSKGLVFFAKHRQLVAVAVGHSMFCFMDEFNGYSQTKMDPYDAKKTALETPTCNFLLYRHAVWPEIVGAI